MTALASCFPQGLAGPADCLAGLALLACARQERAEPHAAGAAPLSADLEDVRASVDGDGEAYRRLIERHQGLVAALMWRFSRDPETHEELVQDVFVQAYLSLRTYRGEAPFAHWISRVAVRAGYRFWKQRQRERSRAALSLEEWNGLPAQSPEAMEPSQAAEIVHRLLGRLPVRDRLVLTLRYLEDRSVEETARLTGWSETMVKVQTWRARGKLRKFLEREKVRGMP